MKTGLYRVNTLENDSARWYTGRHALDFLREKHSQPARRLLEVQLPAEPDGWATVKARLFL